MGSCALIETPVGQLLLVDEAERLKAITFLGAAGSSPKDARPSPASTRTLKEVAAQLRAYFEGRLTSFDLPLAPDGTPFQQSVWRALTEIPYGETRSYRDVARRIGNANATRAVGAANGQNPLPIVIPCHRVIGSNGTLTGYGGGLAIKQRLLALERARSQPRFWPRT